MLHCGKGDFRVAQRMTQMQHSVAHKPYKSDDRLFSPAATHNTAPIIKALLPHLPTQGDALEIASGTGEHVIALARQTPGLIWQPTDINAQRLASIAAWTTHDGANNVLPPLSYDAVESPWNGAPMAVVFLSNLTHLISTAAARHLLAHLADALAPSGTLAIYGPFLRGTDYASDGDARFDAAIRAERPEAGYKDIGWVEDELAGHGLTQLDTIAMPANNLMTLWNRPA